MRGRMKDFPREVVINGNAWRIRWRRNPLIHDDHPGVECWGLCHFDERLIELSMRLKPRERLQAFWHELGHALSHEYPKLRLSHRQIYALEVPLRDLFQTNTWIQWAEWRDIELDEAG